MALSRSRVTSVASHVLLIAIGVDVVVLLVADMVIKAAPQGRKLWGLELAMAFTLIARCIALGFIVIEFSKRRSISTLLKNIRISVVLAVLGIGVIQAIALKFASEAILHFVGMNPSQDAWMLRDEISDPARRVQRWISTFSAIAISPVFEELAYRKYLLTQLRHRIGLVSAMAISIVAFVTIHLDAWSTVSVSGMYNARMMCVLLVAFYYSFLFLFTRRIWVGIAFHFLNNLVAIFFAEHWYR